MQARFFSYSRWRSAEKFSWRPSRANICHLQFPTGYSVILSVLVVFILTLEYKIHVGHWLMETCEIEMLSSFLHLGVSLRVCHGLSKIWPWYRNFPTHPAGKNTSHANVQALRPAKYTFVLIWVLLAWLYLHREDYSHGKYGLCSVTSCGVFIAVWSPKTLSRGVDSFASNSADVYLRHYFTWSLDAFFDANFYQLA